MRSGGLATILLAATLSVAAGAAHADCAALDAQIRAAIQGGDIRSMADLSRAITGEASCDSAYVDRAQRAMALATLKTGQEAAGGYRAEAVELAASFARPWQVNLALGDVFYARGDYAGAVEAYEGAINEIRNETLVPNPPSPDVERYLAQRAYQAKSLAPTYISSRGFRGEPAGVIVPRFRNFSAVSVPVPIRFKTDEASLTADGERAVDDLYNFLSSQQARLVRLVGHTDETGTNAYNQKLSEARAAAVAKALKARGLQLRIEIAGAGESAPFEADDRAKYATEELYAFDRRVEFELVE